VVIEVPSQHYRDKEDRVSFVAIDKDGAERAYPNAVCYGTTRFGRQREDYEYLCRPTEGLNTSPPLVFQRFFRLLRRHRIIPTECQAKNRGGQNVLVVPRLNWGYHPLFVTMGMYRHADCHGKSILGRTMHAYAALQTKGIHFLQCLHWAFSSTPYRAYHSFINLTVGDGMYERDPRRVRDLRWGLALALYSQMSWEEKHHLAGECSTDMFDGLAWQLKQIPLCSPDEILEPRHTEYYINPDKARIGSQ